MSSKPPFIHESAYVDDGAKVGNGTKIWHFCHVLPGAEIGEDCSLGQNVMVANNVRIGNGVKIQNNVSVYEGVILEDYVFCGPSMVFTNVLTPRSEFPRNTSADYAPTLVKRGASIGANATIVCGITLHEGAFVAAGAVVTKGRARLHYGCRHTSSTHRLHVCCRRRPRLCNRRFGHRLTRHKYQKLSETEIRRLE